MAEKMVLNAINYNIRDFVFSLLSDYKMIQIEEARKAAKELQNNRHKPSDEFMKSLEEYGNVRT